MQAPMSPPYVEPSGVTAVLDAGEGPQFLDESAASPAIIAVVRAASAESPKVNIAAEGAAIQSGVDGTFKRPVAPPPQIRARRPGVVAAMKRASRAAPRASMNLLRVSSSTMANYLTRDLPIVRSPESIQAMPWRSRLNLYLEYPEESQVGWRLQQSIILVLVVNICLMTAETLDGPRFGSTEPAYDYIPGQSTFNATQLLFTIFYVVEFAARWATARSQMHYWKSISTWFSLLAMIAAFPKLAAVAMGIQSAGVEDFMNYLRLFRIVRLIVLAQVYVGTKVLIRAALQAIAPLKITLFFLITVVMVFATAIFYAEPCYDLQTCTFTDIFNAGYFVMVTVATVGYGGQVPSLHNAGALLITCIVMIFGTLYLAMPLAIVGIKYELAWREHDERVRHAQQARRNRPLGEIAADVAAETKRRPPVVRIGAVGALDLLDSDETLEPLETQAVKRASSGACDRFYELSQQLVGVDLSLQQLIAIATKAPSTLLTVDNVLQLTKRRSDGTSQALDAIMSVLKLHKHVCADVYALLPSLSRESPTKSAAVNADRRKSIRILSAMGLTSKSGDARSSSASSAIASATLSQTKSALARFGSRVMSSSAKERARHTDPNSRRAVIWSMFEHRNDVRVARIGNKVRFYAVLLSIALFYLQTTPELQETGLRSVLCQRSIRDFCDSHDEPGCYVFHENSTSGSDSGGNTSVSVTSEHVRFDCAINASDPTCYASGVNFGSENFPLPCNETFGVDGISRICNNRLCNSSLRMIFDMEPHWVYFEFLFGILFTTELALCAYAHPARHQLWRDVGVLVDVLVLFPFYVEVGEIIAGDTPTYSIVPTTPSFFTAIRILKTLRILKLGVHIPGARVLTKTAQLIWRRLMIPLFFLFTGCVVSAAVFYELERGTECFVGMRCMWWGIDVLTPEMSEGLPLGKRILVQNTNPTIITDMLRSTWFSLVTFTTVGYGDLYPRTILGKLFDIVGTIFSACYTAMPLTLVGGQFYICYDVYAKEEKRLRRGAEAPVEPKEPVVSPLAAIVRDRLGSLSSRVPTPPALADEQELLINGGQTPSPISIACLTANDLAPPTSPSPLLHSTISSCSPPASIMPTSSRKKRVIAASSVASMLRMEPSVASVELDTLNQFILMHKVFNEMIEDLSTLNRLGTERITAARKGVGSSVPVRPVAVGALDGAAMLADVNRREEAVETKISKNMVFCLTVLLNFTPVIEYVLGTSETPRSPPTISPTTPLLAAKAKSIQKKADTTLTKGDANHSNNDGGIASDDVQLASPTTSNVETQPSVDACESEKPSP